MLAAAIVCVHLYLENEPGAELYSGAAEREQARLCFDMVASMIRNESHMESRADLLKYSITVGGKSYKALSAEAGSKHGFSPQLVVNDELHAQLTPELTEVMMTGTLKRRQPLVVHLTTSDYEREGSICNEKHDYATKVRDGVIEDRSFLPVIYTGAFETSGEQVELDLTPSVTFTDQKINRTMIVNATTLLACVENDVSGLASANSTGMSSSPVWGLSQ